MRAKKEKKRKWVYIQHPTVYEIFCDKCGGSHIDWSEYEHKIWCYDCKEDRPGTGGIFDDPIAMNLCALLGISFKRYYFKSGKIMKPITSGHKIIYRRCSKAELANIKVNKRES